MRYILLFIAGTCLFACTSSSKKTAAVDAIHLSADNLYNKDTVLLIANSATEKNSASDKLFLDGIDKYRNKKNPAAGIESFKQSILQKPQAKAYYELGNALFDKQEMKEAIKAYGIAELLDYKPLHKVLYNMACAYSRIGDNDWAKYYLVSAIEFGYSNVKNIFADKDLEGLRQKDGYSFRSEVTAALSGATDPEKLQWNLFWHEFKPLTFPVTLDMKYADKLGEDYISYDYERFVPEMRNAQFSREVGSEYYHVGLVKNSDSIKTLIYAVEDVVMERSAPAQYYIVSFDKMGKLIDKLLIGGQKKLDEPFRVATIQENGSIQIGLFKQVYEKDPEKEGYQDNQLLESKEIGKEDYSITADGHFVKPPVVLAMNG
jgi:tetratricopeptide (TPR) repeat protein